MRKIITATSLWCYLYYLHHTTLIPGLMVGAHEYHKWTLITNNQHPFTEGFKVISFFLIFGVGRFLKVIENQEGN